MRLSFDRRFVSGDDLVAGKIHTIRRNYDFWKKREGKEVELFYWEDKPYKSKQVVFCVKKIEFVQGILYSGTRFHADIGWKTVLYYGKEMDALARNDGFDNWHDFLHWFMERKYKKGRMGIIHFTGMRY